MRKTDKKIKINIKVIILAIIALILGYAIYNQQAKQALPPSPSPNISTQPRLLPSNLTDDEKFILNPPPADASRSAKDKHAEVVAKLAKVGDQLEIKDCQPKPLVLQVKQGSMFKIKNNDNTEHRIIFDSDHIYKIPPNGSTDIKADFKYGTGDYGYVCEGMGKAKIAGFIHIVPLVP